MELPLKSCTGDFEQKEILKTRQFPAPSPSPTWNIASAEQQSDALIGWKALLWLGELIGLQ